MKTKPIYAPCAILALVITLSATSHAALTPRVDIVQQGDFILIGNTLTQDCGPNAAPHPQGATCSGIMAGDLNDKAPDIFWRADPASAKADDTITMDQAQSTVFLNLPSNATVTHAFLYWSAQGQAIGFADDKVTLTCVGKAPIDISATHQLVSGESYQCGADISTYIQQNASCAYMLSGLSSLDFKNIAAPSSYGHSSFWIAVLYSDPSQPHRRLSLFDGLEDIGNGNVAPLSVPNLNIPKNFAQFSSAKVGIIAYEGDTGLGGDQLIWVDPSTMLQTPLKDNGGNENDFFNSSRSYFGAPLSPMGDLPQVSGAPGSMSHFDMDVVDISSLLQTGQSQLQLAATSVEPVLLAGFISSLPVFSDEDNDGLSDDEEKLAHTNPLDQDSDDDGVLDGQEGCSKLDGCTAPAWNVDTDGDGLIHALDPDSDNDGLFDGTELGLDCNNKATDASQGHCRADADTGSQSDPLDADTDDGGVKDGAEDFNLDGKTDTGETDASAGHGGDDSSGVDTDGDGLSDGLEYILDSDKNDLDSDDDGLSDSQEANPSDDSDNDGLNNINDVDSDNDGLFDGTETGNTCNSLGDPANLGHCVADADGGQTKTSPVNADTDYGGARDGAEDFDFNGAQDGANEGDPTAGHPDDDGLLVDSDGDGLSDGEESTLGSNPMDADSDDDGALDGMEPNPSDDEDGDTIVNIMDADSDADKLLDGTEMGLDCANPATDKSRCIPDGDKGKSTTSPVNADTDGGGMADGYEDCDQDGVFEINQGEGNPLDPSDDSGILLCNEDSDCGPAQSGKICAWVPGNHGSCAGGSDGTTCIDGCRLNFDCPEPMVCFVAPGEEIGYCGEIAVENKDQTSAEVEGGCLCELSRQKDENDRPAFGFIFTACGLMMARRRRRRGEKSSP